MARTPRMFVLDEEAGGLYHCINRCVRRAFLCGADQVSGKSFEHRREWIRQRLEFLAGEFGIDVLGYAVMSNHLHAILRTRPDVVRDWSDEEVATRWWGLFPWRRESDGSAAAMRADELQAMLSDAKKLTEWRKRLASVSWFMRCLAEPIARQANREDECTGRFWEGRFKCQPLLDEAALLACCVYVDLNPIRARVAKTPETSRFTSAYDRIQALKASVAESQKSEVRPAESGSRRAAVTGTSAPSPAAAPDGWLSPIELARDLDDVSSASASPKSSTTTVAMKSSARPARRRTPEERLRRASFKGFLSMTLADYLSLLDWTGRQLRRDKRGAIPAEMQPLFARLKISG
ncbi:MAG: transposase, partial [Planctomycetaceae bacterium]